MNEKKPTWICPVCDKPAIFDNLVIDGLFMEILRKSPDSADIQFIEDGSWQPLKVKEERGSPIIHSIGLSESDSPKKKEDVTIIDLTCSSDEEEVEDDDVVDSAVMNSSTSSESESPTSVSPQTVNSATPPTTQSTSISGEVVRLSPPPSLVDMEQTSQLLAGRTSLRDSQPLRDPPPLRPIPNIHYPTPDYGNLDLFSLLQPEDTNRIDKDLDNLLQQTTLTSCATTATSQSNSAFTSCDNSTNSPLTVMDSRNSTPPFPILSSSNSNTSSPDVISLD